MHKFEKVFYITGMLVCLLVASAGVSFSYFAAEPIGVNQSEAFVMTSRDGFNLTFTDGEPFDFESIVPGWRQTKSFTITNESEFNLRYNVLATNVFNDLVHRDNLIISISSTAGGGESVQRPVPTMNETLIPNAIIEAGSTQTYTVTIQYLEADYDTSADMGRSFDFRIEIG